MSRGFFSSYIDLTRDSHSEPTGVKACRFFFVDLLGQKREDELVRKNPRGLMMTNTMLSEASTDELIKELSRRELPMILLLRDGTQCIWVDHWEACTMLAEAIKFSTIFNAQEPI